MNAFIISSSSRRGRMSNSSSSSSSSSSCSSSSSGSSSSSSSNSTSRSSTSFKIAFNHTIILSLCMSVCLPPSLSRSIPFLSPLPLCLSPSLPTSLIFSPHSQLPSQTNLTSGQQNGKIIPRLETRVKYIPSSLARFCACRGF